MIATDEDALICDLAETYQIFNYRGLPVQTVAVLSVGLRADSRIKMKLAKQKINFRETMLTATVDLLRDIEWLLSSDGTKGINRPESLLNAIYNLDKKKNTETFNDAESFEKKRKEILQRLGG